MLEAAFDRADQAGLIVEEAALPLADQHVATYAGVQGGEALAWHRSTGRWPAHAAAYGRDVRERLREAEAAEASGTGPAAAALRPELRRRVAALFEQVDVLLMPVATSGPPAIATPTLARGPGGRMVQVREAVLPHTVLANLCGLPACSVPVGYDDDGLPVGLQVVGPPGHDARVLDVAAACRRRPAEPGFVGALPARPAVVSCHCA